MKKKWNETPQHRRRRNWILRHNMRESEHKGDIPPKNNGASPTDKTFNTSHRE
ncbi:MAG: hypothetical protein JW740_00805 [Candidatus Zambryskibacteria bacterium]|nr:hypothetical protein [Candidatus Zambryskibacteria bacterium]